MPEGALPECVHVTLTDAWLVNLQRFVDAVGDRVQVLQICDDLGTQESLFLSVRMFRELMSACAGLGTVARPRRRVAR